MKDLAFTIPALHEAYANGATPEQIISEVYRRIEAVSDPGIFLHLPPLDAALTNAASLGAFDPARPLWGIPFAVKDNIDVAGMPTTAGCPAYAYEPDTDAFTIARLRDAGALPIGKTNLDQFATGLVGVRTPHPAPKNALDPAIAPGGSSSGSAVAVAHGFVPFALGTDTAGSGRVPAGLNNIVGLKPTLGALSATGLVPACRTLDTISILAQTTADAYAVYRAAAGYDGRDAYSRAVAVPPLAALPPKLRIGRPDRESIRFDGDSAQQASYEATLQALNDAGHAIVEIDFQPFYDIAEMLYEGAWVAERHSVISALLNRDPEAIHPVTRSIIGKALSLSATDAFRGFYRLEDLRRAAEPGLSAVDLLCVPTVPSFPTIAQLEADPVGPNSRAGTYTNFVNLLGLCGISVPVAPRGDGRPGGVTLLAAAGRDGHLASLATRLEHLGARSLGATGWPVPPAPELASRALSDEIEIAVCGAHMSGMALNHELTARRGRFLRVTKTVPDYRLFALPGGPPARPGLLRVGAGQGAPIHVEVWATPKAEFGGFLEGVPRPLGIGTILLADGSAPKGFLCEQIATVGADDVTAIGDWRKVQSQMA
ncbi:MAG: allophanate hydrolase [Pseudomonadota bacterium]